MSNILVTGANGQLGNEVKRPAFSVLDKTKVKKDFDYRIPYWKESLIRCIHELN